MILTIIMVGAFTGILHDAFPGLRIFERHEAAYHVYVYMLLLLSPHEAFRPLILNVL